MLTTLVARQANDRHVLIGCVFDLLRLAGDCFASAFGS
jgi:hypothetical protein